MSLTRSSFGRRSVPVALALPQEPPKTVFVPTMAKIAANTSASQHETFALCKRKWAFGKVWGIKDRDKPYFVFGHALHAVADLYLSGTAKSWEALFPTGWNKGLDEYESNQIQTMAKQAVENGTWQAVPGSLVEFALAFVVGPQFIDARGLPLLAKAETYKDESGVRRVAQLTSLYDGKPLPSGWDVIPPYVGFIDHMILDAEVPTIADHKTAKKREYARTPAKLAEDGQVLSYAAVPLVLRPDVDLVKLRHNVFLKNADAPTPVYPVNAEAPLAKVRATWDRIRASSAEMLRIREDAPKIVDAGNPYRRADNWKKVRSAIEEGRTKEACDKYGGCAFKDVCFGRATAEQVVRRLDSPDPMQLIQRSTGPPKPEVTFGFRPRPSPTPTPSQEHPTMVFATKPLTVNQDIYIVDEEDAGSQYRGRVIALLADSMVELALYPNPDVAPDFATLGAAYRGITVPGIKVLALPHVTAKVKGYQEALVAAGIADGLEWTPAPVAATPVVAATAKVQDKPARDGAFGFKKPGQAAPAALVQPTTPPSTPAAPIVAPAAVQTPPVSVLPPGTPGWALAGVADGTVLTVKPTEHPFWKPLVGKQAKVTGSAPGEIAGSTDLHVIIDDLPYPAANAHRFQPTVVSAAVLPTALPDRAKALQGKVVSIRLKTTESPFNCVLEVVSPTGISILSGQVTSSWEEIESIEPLTTAAIPGAKPTAEEKAAAKEQAKAEKEAAKATEKAAKEAAKVAEKAAKDAAAQTALAGTVPPPTVSIAGSLSAALEAVQAALTGGKVTKKVLEGVLPLLQSALQHQTNLESGAPAAPVAAPQIDGTLRAGLDHMIATATELRGRLG